MGTLADDRELSRLELHREPRRGSLLLRPCVKRCLVVKLDGVPAGAEDSRRSLRVVFGDDEAVGARPWEFAGEMAARRARLMKEATPPQQPGPPTSIYELNPAADQP